MKRAFKIGLLLLGAMAVVVWFAAMAALGMAKQDEWYGDMDKGAASEAPIPACKDDDAAYGPCYWDSEVQGNGEGKSFTVDEHGNVTYWEDYAS